MSAIRKREIQKLLERYLKRRCSPEENEIINKWLDSLLAQKDNLLVDLEHKEVQLREFIQTAIQSESKISEKGKALNITGRFTLFYRIAALIIISCGVLYFVVSNRENVQSRNAYVTEIFTAKKSAEIIENKLQEKKEIRLADGSVILLDKGGRIEIESSFKSAGERIIHLEGKAFFKVAHDASRPFLVITKNLVTKVLGTSFTVRAERGKEEGVEVKTGKVAVYRNQARKIQWNAEPFATIPANHQIRFDSARNKLVESIVERPSFIPTLERKEYNTTSSVHLDSRHTRRKFDGAPAAEILKALEEAYGIKIKFDPSNISECIITATLDSDDFYVWLQTVCDLIGGKYQINGTEIEVISSGCK